MELTQYQLGIVARTVNAEAGGEIPEGQAAVAAVIMNRAMAGWNGGDPAAVALHPAQFSAWNKGRGGNDIVKRTPPAAIVELVKGVFAGTIKDPTGGATHFLNKEATRAGRPGHNLPSWWNTMVAKNGEQRIGNHWFTSNAKIPPQGVPNPTNDWRGQTLKPSRLVGVTPAVKDLQNMLVNAGYLKGDNVDGTMKPGGLTERAVRAFQRDNGLKVDGRAGPRTFAALQGAVATAAVKSMVGVTAPWSPKGVAPYTVGKPAPGTEPSGAFPAARIPSEAAIPRGGVGQPISGLKFAERFGPLSTESTSPTGGENFTPPYQRGLPPVGFSPGPAQTLGPAEEMAREFARLPTALRGGTYSVDAGTAGPTATPSWAKLPSGPGRSPSTPKQTPAKVQAAFDKALADFREQEKIIQEKFPEYKPAKAPPSGPGRAPSGPVPAPGIYPGGPPIDFGAGGAAQTLGLPPIPLPNRDSPGGIVEGKDWWGLPPDNKAVMAKSAIRDLVQGSPGIAPIGADSGVPFMPNLVTQVDPSAAIQADQGYDPLSSISQHIPGGFGVDMSMGGEGALNPEQPGSQVNQIWNAAGRNPTFNPYESTPLGFGGPTPMGVAPPMAGIRMGGPGRAPTGGQPASPAFSPNIPEATSLSGITSKVDAGPSLNGMGFGSFSPVASFNDRFGAPPLSGGVPPDMSSRPPTAAPSSSQTMSERFATDVGSRNAPVLSVTDFKAGFDAGQASVISPAAFGQRFNPAAPDISGGGSTDFLGGGTRFEDTFGPPPSPESTTPLSPRFEGAFNPTPPAAVPVPATSPAPVALPGAGTTPTIPGVSVVGDPGVATPSVAVGNYDVLSGTGTAGALASAPAGPAAPAAPVVAPPLQAPTPRPVAKAAPATKAAREDIRTVVNNIIKQAPGAFGGGALFHPSAAFGGGNAAGVGAPIRGSNTVTNPQGGVIQFGAGGAPPSSPFYNGSLGYAISGQSGFPLTASQIYAELSNPGFTTYKPSNY